MDEQEHELADGSPQGRKPNSGWFQPGDGRINREGRPKGSKVLVPDDLVVDCAPRADRLMRLFVRGRELGYKLRNLHAPWAENLPRDSEVVDCRYDETLRGAFLIIRSATFPRIARGTPIPQFELHYKGLMYGRHWEPDGEYTPALIGDGYAMRRV